MGEGERSGGVHTSQPIMKGVEHIGFKLKRIAHSAHQLSSKLAVTLGRFVGTMEVVVKLCQHLVGQHHLVGYMSPLFTLYNWFIAYQFLSCPAGL